MPVIVALPELEAVLLLDLPVELVDVPFDPDVLDAPLGEVAAPLLTVDALALPDDPTAPDVALAPPWVPDPEEALAGPLDAEVDGPDGVEEVVPKGPAAPPLEPQAPRFAITEAPTRSLRGRLCRGRRMLIMLAAVAA